jgi:hypothetical protein
MLYAGTPKSAHNKYSKVANIPVVETKAMTNLAFGAEFPVAWGRISSLGKDGLVVGTGEAVTVPSSSGRVTTFVGDKVLFVPPTAGTIVGVGVILESTVGFGEAVAVPLSGRVTTFVGEKVSKIGTAEVGRSDATAGWDEDSSYDGVLETSDGLGDGDEVS